VCTGGGNSDSLFWNFDNDTPVNQGFTAPDSFGTWYSFAGVTLTAGSHTLSLQMREPVGIGAIKLTSTIYPGTYYNVTPITMSGAPLFNQLSQSAASSVVGAFSLRAVNGVTAKAVQVQAHPVVQWPPAAMTSNTTTYTGQSYGNSTFVTTASVPNSSIWVIFDNNINTYYEQATAFPYNAATGAYGGSNATTISSASVSGEWFQLQLPTSIVLRSYTLVGRQDNNWWRRRNPTTFWIAGSNNGTDWSNVHQQSDIKPPQEGITINVPVTSNSVAWSYYRLVVNVIGNSDYSGGQKNLVNLSSWNLYGDSPSYAPNPAQDFYADERGNLLTAPVVGTTLRNWLGGATGYVTKWYDQSGKGNDASQNTAADQPIIQRATKGAGYSCFFNGTTNYLTGMSYNILNSTNFSFNVVERRTGSSSGGTATNDLTLLSCGDIGATGKLLYLTYRNNTNSLFGSWSPELFTTITAYNSPSEPIRYTCATASSTSGRRVYIYNDPLGNPIASSDAAQTSLMSMTSGNFQIGYYVFGSSTSYYKGEIYELLVFTQSLYDLDVTTSINQIYQNQLSYTGT
jgi:hypothetical protein